MKLLVVTHTFPPTKHSNAKRPMYLVRGFLDAGWEVDVMTSDLGADPDEDEVMVHPGLTIIREKEPVWRIRSRLKNANFDRLAGLWGLVANGFLFPDSCAIWARKIFRKIKKVGGEYDRVLAFVFPPSVLLSGDKGIVDHRWVFDFQESVTPQFERFPRKSFLQRARQKKLSRMERETLHKAGAVVFTAESNRKAYVEGGLVPGEKTKHIPYFYDEEIFQSTAPVQKDFEIGYYGNFDLTGSRSPEVFLQSLAGFLDRHPQARVETKFVFHGLWLPRHDEIIEDLKLGDVCQINEAVSYEEYLEKLKTSPVLLLIVAREHDLFMPSKIVDYFGAGRPILAFVPDGSEMSGVLKSAQMAEFSCPNDDASKGADAIERLWSDYQSNNLKTDKETTSKWSSSRLLPRYCRLLEEDSHAH